MKSAEEFINVIDYFYDAAVDNDAFRAAAVPLVKQRDLEQRIAGLREAAGMTDYRSEDAQTRIYARITELEKELKK